MRFIIFLFCFFISLHVEALDVKQAIEIALKNSPKVKSAQLDLKLTDQDIRYAVSTYYPSLDFVSKYTYTKDNYKEYDQKNNQLQIGIEITQNIYDFGRTDSTYDSAELAKRIQIKLFEDSLNRTVLEVRDGFNKIYQNLYLLDIAIEENKIMKERVKQIYGLYNGGIRSKYDVSTVKLKALNTDKNIKRLQSRVEKSIDNLKKVIGITQDIKIERVESKIEIETIKNHLKNIEIDKEMLIDRLDNANPKLLAFKYKTKQRRADVEAKEADLMPELDFIASAYSYPEDNYRPRYESEYRSSWEVGIRFRWNIFDGFRDEIGIQKASVAYLKSDSDFTRERLELINRLENLVAEVKKSKGVLQESFKEIELAKENVAIARSQYSSGLIDIWQYLLSEENLIETKRSLVENYYSMLSSLYEIEYLLANKEVY